MTTEAKQNIHEQIPGYSTPKQIWPFAVLKDYIKEEHLYGELLIICDQEYKAWKYDTYIYDAMLMAAKWQPEQVTYDRVTWLRYWLRENLQHGHDLPYDRIRTMKGVKLFIDKLILAEYQHDGEDDYWKEQREFSLKQNEEHFK